MLRAGSASAENGWDRMTCTWWLLGLAVKATSLASGWPILALAASAGLENATLTLRALLSGR